MLCERGHEVGLGLPPGGLIRPYVDLVLRVLPGEPCAVEPVGYGVGLRRRRGGDEDASEGLTLGDRGGIVQHLVYDIVLVPLVVRPVRVLSLRSAGGSLVLVHHHGVPLVLAPAAEVVALVVGVEVEVGVLVGPYVVGVLVLDEVGFADPSPPAAVVDAHGGLPPDTDKRAGGARGVTSVP